MKLAVIFDMDGVIADSEYLNVKAKHLILKHEGIEVDWHYHDQYFGTTHEFMWTKMKQEFNLKQDVSYYIQKWVKTRKELMNKEGIQPMPGVINLIHKLQERQISLAVASSSLKEDIMENMKAFQIEDCFQAFVSGSECKNGKPDPEIFLKAAKMLGKEPKDCVVVEDSTAGVQAAKAAGMKCVGYAPRQAVKQDIHQADWILHDFEENIVEKILE